jgi:UrcA family protein
MPTTNTTRIAGRALLAGLLGLGASAALAAADPEMVVSDNPGNARTVAVEVADLDLTRAYDRDTLAIRIANAAREVCDVHDGSKLDKQAGANACLAQARAAALAQLESRGLNAPQMRSAGGGM